MMTRIGGVLGLLWAGVGSAFRDPFLVLGFSTEGGPYAKIVDVHKGTACLLDELKLGENPTPPECECSFSRLSEAKARCAAVSMAATQEEKEECASIPCEVCCSMRVATIPLPGEDRTHLECKKKCPSSDEVIPITEDVSMPVFQALIDLTDVHHPTATVELPPAFNTTRASPVLPPPAVAAWVTPPRAASEAIYTNRQLPSEDNLLDKYAPPPTPDLETLSRANNEIIAQMPVT